MASEKVETVVAGNYVEMEREEDGEGKSTTSAAKTSLSKIFWNGGSVYDAWFSCASNQVAQVLLTLPYSFSQLGMVSGILFQLFYGLMGSWTAYLISVLYVEYRTRKEREKVDFRNHVIQWFEVLDGLGKHWRKHRPLFQLHISSIWICDSAHCMCKEIMHAMWKPQKFKLIYLMATIYVLTLTLPSASAVYWAFGDLLLNRSNALALLPRTGFRDTAVILMLIHQRALARLPVVIPIWFLAIIFPFFGPINSTVGSLLVSFTVYIIPAMAHMITFASASARENAVERAPKIVGGWTGLYVTNIFVVAWVFIVGFGFGGWASMVNFVHQINSFGLFAKCYQCPKHKV
ncbi:Auxin transporter-like protein 3 [Sesamum angolense]|uniref:Auxin transporter-like protein 3 n=1 Tax=Sesamum angolense TaxID=2727404 RepID=A0AAE1WD78_9LAMI|nr:Auxin transporter-like protein 3 [Sesamum angolense]